MSARRSSSRREARKAASVGSGCEEMASTSACAAGERKECGGVGVGCDRRGAGAGAGAAVRWSRSESSGSEEGDGGGGAAGMSGPRFLGPAGRVGLFGNSPRPVASIGGGGAGWPLGAGEAGDDYELVSVEGRRRPARSMSPRGKGIGFTDPVAGAGGREVGWREECGDWRGDPLCSSVWQMEI